MNHKVSWLPTTDTSQPVPSDTIPLQRVTTVPLEPPLLVEPQGPSAGLFEEALQTGVLRKQRIFPVPVPGTSPAPQGVKALAPSRWEV